jgi:hypothetical protein
VGWAWEGLGKWGGSSVCVCVCGLPVGWINWSGGVRAIPPIDRSVNKLDRSIDRSSSADCPKTHHTTPGKKEHQQIQATNQPTNPSYQTTSNQTKPTRTPTSEIDQGLESLLGKDDELVQEVKRLDSDMQVRFFFGGGGGGGLLEGMREGRRHRCNQTNPKNKGNGKQTHARCAWSAVYPPPPTKKQPTAKATAMATAPHARTLCLVCCVTMETYCWTFLLLPLFFSPNVLSSMIFSA